MMKISWCCAMFAVCGASLLAQSAGSRVETKTTTQTVQDLPGETSDITADHPSNVPQPPIINILSVIGNNTLGLPCLNCILGILLPTLGLPSPLGTVLRGNNYQIDSFLIDNSYTGPCIFTSTMQDSLGNVIVSTTQTLTEKAKTQILLKTPVTIPTTAGIGLGTISTNAACGTSNTTSKTPVFIACVTDPPFCVN